MLHCIHIQSFSYLCSGKGRFYSLATLKVPIGGNGNKDGSLRKRTVISSDVISIFSWRHTGSNLHGLLSRIKFLIVKRWRPKLGDGHFGCHITRMDNGFHIVDFILKIDGPSCRRSNVVCKRDCFLCSIVAVIVGISLQIAIEPRVKWMKFGHVEIPKGIPFAGWFW